LPLRPRTTGRTIVKHLEHDRQRQADLIKAGSDVPPALAHAIDVWAPTAFDEIAAVVRPLAVTMVGQTSRD